MPGRPIKLDSRCAPGFPDLRTSRPGRDGLVALGGNLQPETLIEAYSKGIFPWEADDPIPWFSPDPRCILRPEDFHTSHSLAKLDRKGRYRVTADLRFREVVRGCATIHRPGQRGTWISDRMGDSYETLYRMGIAHSIEVWDGYELVGGLYGLAMGRAFFGESMFSARPNTSKLAMRHLCQTLQAWEFHFIDCQQHTSHLQSLGAVTVPRATYLDLLEDALAGPDMWNPAHADMLVL